MSLAGNATLPVWGNYVDLEDDVKPWLQLQSTDTTKDTLLQIVIDGICQWAQNKLGQPIGPTTFDRRFDGWQGWNGAHIMLPYYPVLEVKTVTEWWGVSGPHDLTEQTPTNQVDGFQCEYLTGRMTRVFPGLVQKPWFPGSRNIEISWVAGRNPVPGDLRLATLEDVAYWWRNTQQSGRGGRGEYGGAEGNTGLWIGTPTRVADLLNQYLQVGMG
jgi:hypothetical protein